MFPILLFHEVCQLFNIYLFIDGLKLETKSLNEFDLMQQKILLVDLPFIPKETNITWNPTENNISILQKFVVIFWYFLNLYTCMVHSFQYLIYSTKLLKDQDFRM